MRPRKAMCSPRGSNTWINHDYKTLLFDVTTITLSGDFEANSTILTYVEHHSLSWQFTTQHDCGVWESLLPSRWLPDRFGSMLTSPTTQTWHFISFLGLNRGIKNQVEHEATDTYRQQKQRSERPRFSLSLVWLCNKKLWNHLRKSRVCIMLSQATHISYISSCVSRCHHAGHILSTTATPNT